MAVPDYQSLMLPLLKIAIDGQEHGISEVFDTIALQLRLTDHDRKELLPSGNQPRFENRVRWAALYLRKAGLLERPGRGKFRITERGLEVLKDSPSNIDVNYLMRFPEFVEFRFPSQEVEKQKEIKKVGETPEEILEASYQDLRRALADELIERVKSCSPRFFERVVVSLLVAMGYGGSRQDAGEAIGKTGDGGIDGIINEDKLGLDVVYVQAKRWEGAVGRPDVQKFAGSLEGQRARKGVLITTSQFSPKAKDYVGRIEKKIVLIDGEKLAQLMIDYGIGVTEVASFTMKKIDLDYFGDEE